MTVENQVVQQQTDQSERNQKQQLKLMPLQQLIPRREIITPDVDDCQGMIAATHLAGIPRAGGLPEGWWLQKKSVKQLNKRGKGNEPRQIELQQPRHPSWQQKHEDS